MMAFPRQRLDDRTRNPCKVFVGGIGQSTVESTLREHFSRYGPVLDCVIVSDRRSGRSRGFGFVTFPLAETVDHVLRDKHKIDDVLVECRHALPRDEARGTAPYDTMYMPNKVFVGGIPESIQEEHFREFFTQFGHVVDASLAYDKNNHRPRGFGFIVYETIEAVDLAVGHHFIGGKWVEAKRAVPRELPPQGRGRTKLRRGGGAPPPFSPPGDSYHAFSSFSPSNFQFPTPLAPPASPSPYTTAAVASHFRPSINVEANVLPGAALPPRPEGARLSEASIFNPSARLGDTAIMTPYAFIDTHSGGITPGSPIGIAQQPGHTLEGMSSNTGPCLDVTVGNEEGMLKYYDTKAMQNTPGGSATPSEFYISQILRSNMSSPMVRPMLAQQAPAYLLQPASGFVGDGCGTTPTWPQQHPTVHDLLHSQQLALGAQQLYFSLQEQPAQTANTFQSLDGQQQAMLQMASAQQQQQLERPTTVFAPLSDDTLPIKVGTPLTPITASGSAAEASPISSLTNITTAGFGLSPESNLASPLAAFPTAAAVSTDSTVGGSRIQIGTQPISAPTTMMSTAAAAGTVAKSLTQPAHHIYPIVNQQPNVWTRFQNVGYPLIDHSATTGAGHSINAPVASEHVGRHQSDSASL